MGVLTRERDAKDTSQEGDGVDPDSLLFAELQVAVVVGAVVRVQIVESWGGPHEHRTHAKTSNCGCKFMSSELLDINI